MYNETLNGMGLLDVLMQFYGWYD